MQKVPSLITNGQIDPLYDWIYGETAVATRMYDGLSYAVIRGKPYVHTVTDDFDGHFIMHGIHDSHAWGWNPVPEDDPIFWPVWKEYEHKNFDWSYEIVGPEINGNPEHSPSRVMIPHGSLIIPALTPYWGWKLQPGVEAPIMITVEGIKRYLASRDIEGIVWWRDKQDWGCDKVKAQQSDFGFIRRQVRYRN